MNKQHEEEEVINYKNLYYLIGLLSGLFIGSILEKGFIWVPIMGVIGLLFTAFFLAVFVKGGENS